MKKLLLLGLLAFSFTVNAQQPKTTQVDNYAFVKDLKPITWTKEIRSTNTVKVEGNKLSTTITGAVVGRMIFKRSLLGTLGGGLVGNALGTSDDTKTTTTSTYVQVSGYEITTNDHGTFRTFDSYKKYQVIDMRQVKKE